MTSTDGHDTTRSTPARVVSIVLGAILALLSLGLVASGVALLVGQSALDEDGFVTSPSKRVSTDTYAIASEPFDVHGIDEWPFDDPIRLRLTLDSTEDVFVGVARADEVATALDDVAHEVVVDDEGTVTWGELETERRDGGAPPIAPARLLEWDASATGRDDVSVTWEPTDGEWAVVVMRADGSSDVSARGRIGADVPLLEAVGWSLVVVGAIVGLLAALLIAFGARHGGGEDSTRAATTSAIDRPDARAVRLVARVEEAPSRWLWLVKWLLLIPHYVAIVFLSAAFVIVTIVAWFAIVLTGRYPRSLFEFNLGVLRWNWRINGYSYGAFATDRYPPFSLGAHPGYPATLDIAYPERLSRGLPFVKWLLAAPHLLLLGAAAGGVVIGTARPESTTETGVIGLVVMFIGVGLLVTGRLPSGLFDLLVGIQRWIYRTVAYVALMTDEYPPFRLDQGGDEPVVFDDTGGDLPGP